MSLTVLLDGELTRAAQYNTSAANSWTQLEADDSFSGRNGESQQQQEPTSGATPKCMVSQAVHLLVFVHDASGVARRCRNMQDIARAGAFPFEGPFNIITVFFCRGVQQIYLYHGL